MELKPNEFIYRKGEKAENIYVLLEGKVVSKAVNESNEEKIVKNIEEKNSIIGEIETILSIPRETSMMVTEPAVLKVISTKNGMLRKTILSNTSLGLNIAIGLAKTQKEINERLNMVLEFLNRVKQETDKYCLDYYQISKQIEDQVKKTRFPWLQEISDFSKDNIIFQIGKSVAGGRDYMRTTVKKKNLLNILEEGTYSSSDAVNFKKGEILCSEGEPGNEMFILVEGSWDVLIGEQKVAEINEKGSVLGEIAVLLGSVSGKWEQRTATVKAASDSKIVVIPGSNLKPLIGKDPNLILHICRILAGRLPNTYTKYMEADLKLKKMLNLLNPGCITSSSIPKVYESLSEKLSSDTKNPKLTELLQKRSETGYLKSKESFEKNSKDYSIITGAEYEKASDLVLDKKISDSEKEPEPEKIEDREIERSVYNKITKKMKNQGKINDKVKYDYDSIVDIIRGIINENTKRMKKTISKFVKLKSISENINNYAVKEKILSEDLIELEKMTNEHNEQILNLKEILTKISDEDENLLDKIQKGLS